MQSSLTIPQNLRHPYFVVHNFASVMWPWRFYSRQFNIYIQHIIELGRMGPTKIKVETSLCKLFNDVTMNLCNS